MTVLRYLHKPAMPFLPGGMFDRALLDRGWTCGELDARRPYLSSTGFQDRGDGARQRPSAIIGSPSSAVGSSLGVLMRRIGSVAGRLVGAVWQIRGILPDHS